MEKVFRIALALWMLLLTEHLRANPVHPKKAKAPRLMDLDDLGLDLLHSVSCINNATFTSPTNLDVKCLAAALELFIEGLEQAAEKCDTVHHIKETHEALMLHAVQQKDTDCTFTLTVHDKFQNFVEAVETFTQQFNDFQQTQE